MNMPSASIAHDPRPVVLTMGDPAGIGPEIIVKALRQRPELLPRVVVVGDVPTLQRALQLTRPSTGVSDPLLMPIATLAEAETLPAGCLAVVQACALPEPV